LIIEFPIDLCHLQGLNQTLSITDVSIYRFIAQTFFYALTEDSEIVFELSIAYQFHSFLID